MDFSSLQGGTFVQEEGVFGFCVYSNKVTHEWCSSSTPSRLPFVVSSLSGHPLQTTTQALPTKETHPTLSDDEQVTLRPLGEGRSQGRLFPCPPGQAKTFGALRAHIQVVPYDAFWGSGHRIDSVSVTKIPTVFVEKEFLGLNFAPIQDAVDLDLNLVPDVYCAEFVLEEHYNYIVSVKSPVENYFVSVLSKDSAYQVDHHSFHDVLKTTAKGYTRMTLEISNPADPKVVRDAVLQGAAEDSEWLGVSETTAFGQDLATVETKHPQFRAAMKIGVVYCKRGQITNHDMFANAPEQDHPFWKFVDGLGDKIDLEGWTKYRGDMRPPGTAWYGVWNGIEMIFHVSPILNAEERRRLVGNDVAMLMYFDEPDPSVLFDPSGIDTFGEVPCLFNVVQPFHDGTYRVGFCSKKNIPDYAPPSPSYLYNYNQVKDHVLTKLYNGLVLSNQCPPLNRLFMVPRRATINDIAEKWIPRAKARPSPIGSPASTKIAQGFAKPVDFLNKGTSAAGSAINLSVSKVSSVRVNSKKELGPKTKVADPKKLSTLKKKLSKNGLTPETTKEIEKMWKKLDQDGSGELDLIEAKIFFGNVYDWLSGSGSKSKKLDPQQKTEKREFTINMWITAFDENGDGQISWQEFLAGLNNLLQTENV